VVFFAVKNKKMPKLGYFRWHLVAAENMAYFWHLLFGSRVLLKINEMLPKIT
jgi:hypothetical protein